MKKAVYHSGTCVKSTMGHINSAVTGLEMRTRIYSHGTYTQYIDRNGDADFFSTSFRQTINRHGDKACEALLWQSTGLLYGNMGGPVCESI